MSPRLRRPEMLLGALGVAMLAWLGLVGFAWSDYDDEAARPVAELVHGHWTAFLHASPAYGGSLLLRSPFAFVPRIWGGGELATYRALAVPCLVAGAALGITLVRQRRRRFPDAGWMPAVVLLAAANPITLRALDIGHPEELLGAVLCVGAVLAAIADRPALTAVCLGLAIGNKAWAVLAIGPALVTLEHGRRTAALGAGVIAALLVLPFHLATGAHAAAGADVSTIFQPWQVWWPLGDPGAVVRGIDGLVKPEYRGAPGWIGPIPHPLIAAMWVPVTLLWNARTRGRRAPTDVLLLLALLMLLRCVLDPWNNVYYHLPFLMALLAWEALSSRRPPVASLTAVSLVWIAFQELPGRVSPDTQSAFYLACALPAVVAMTVPAFGVRVPRHVPAGASA